MTPPAGQKWTPGQRERTHEKADYRNPELYGRLNADRLSAEAAEPESERAWRTVQAIERDVADDLPARKMTRPVEPPRPHVARALRRAAARLAAVIDRLDADRRKRADVLAREIEEALHVA